MHTMATSLEGHGGGGRRQLHAVVFPYPAQGHINPAMQLAQRLASPDGGFTVVTFVNTHHNHARILNDAASVEGPHEVCAGGTGGGSLMRMVSIPDGLPDSANRMADLGVLSHALEGHAGPAFDALLAAMLAPSCPAARLVSPLPPPCCVFVDFFLPFAREIATDKYGLPCVAFWLQSAASFAVNATIPLLIQQGHFPFPKGKEKELITSIPGHPPLAYEDIPSFFKVEDPSSDFMCQFKMKQFSPTLKAKHILLNSFYELEPSVVDTLSKNYPLLPMGPFLPPTLLGVESEGNPNPRIKTGLWPEDTTCLRWLDKQAPSSVMYISFGSIASLSPEQFAELIFGLKASQKPLLWAIRPDIMDIISSLIPPDFKSQEDLLCLTSWAPQQLALSHPSVGGFLTHCGWNSTLEAVSMGVPTLCWPYFADQMMNRMWMVDEWKTGMRFEPREDGLVTRQEIARLVRLLMEGEEGKEMRARAVKLRDAARIANSKGGSSYENLQKLILSITSEEP